MSSKELVILAQLRSNWGIEVYPKGHNPDADFLVLKGLIEVNPESDMYRLTEAGQVLCDKVLGLCANEVAVV